MITLRTDVLNDKIAIKLKEIKILEAIRDTHWNTIEKDTVCIVGDTLETMLAPNKNLKYFSSLKNNILWVFVGGMTSITTSSIYQPVYVLPYSIFKGLDL